MVWCRWFGHEVVFSREEVRCAVVPPAIWWLAGAFASLTGAEQGGRLFGHLAGRDCRVSAWLGPPARCGPGGSRRGHGCRRPVAGSRPIARRHRQPGQGKLAGGLEVAGAEGGHDVTAPGIGTLPGPALRLALRADGFHRIPDTPSTRSAMSTTARPMRTMARSLPVNPGVAGRRRRLIPGACLDLQKNLKTSNLFLESVVVFESWRAGAS